MKLSVIILTWNSVRYVDNCLCSLFSALTYENGNIEVFIVDNGSTDGTVQVIENFRRKYPYIIKPIFLDYNLGTTYTRNLALRQSSGRYIAILDSDIILPNDILTPLLQRLQSDPKIGLVVPKLVYPNGKLQRSTDSFPTMFTKLLRYFFLKKIENKENSFSKETCYVDYAISAFWLLKKELVDKVGFLDENIFYAPEDVDYCLRIWKAGYRILYVPDCEVVHDAQELSRGFRLNKAFWEHLKGLVYFFIKHRYFFRKPTFIHSCQNVCIPE